MPAAVCRRHKTERVRLEAVPTPHITLTIRQRRYLRPMRLRSSRQGLPSPPPPAGPLLSRQPGLPPPAHREAVPVLRAAGAGSPAGHSHWTQPQPVPPAALPSGGGGTPCVPSLELRQAWGPIEGGTRSRRRWHTRAGSLAEPAACCPSQPCPRPHRPVPCRPTPAGDAESAPLSHRSVSPGPWELQDTGLAQEEATT